uniref:tRNA methyltransferase O n=1 Tax=Electrophorus electricus TaxID=8005 RepID=A0AAY5ETY1_ELEEL
MAQTACPCSECIQSLKQQVSVMRKEIRNIRQHADSAVRAHRKQMASLQSVLADGWSPGPRPSRDPGGARASLERGHVQTVPVGYISSCFANKSGTPRQPGICTSSRASLQLRASVFNNPEHALAGLDQYSHVWLIFLFHKNGHVSYKAKVKPPRLNGQRVGVYSTRSPHRPNALGLTLARLEDRVSQRRPRFQFLRGPEDAAAAIRALLAADPRSVYRRTRCPDRLFFFTLDTADITCWFGDGFAEVLRVRPACVTLDAAVTPAPPQ